MAFVILSWKKKEKLKKVNNSKIIKFKNDPSLLKSLKIMIK